MGKITTRDVVGGIPILGGLLGGLFDDGPDAPPPRNLTSEIRGVTDLLPDVARTSYGIASEYLPKYTQLELGRDTAVRRGGVSDVAALTPTISQIRRDYAPETRGLLDELIALSRSEIGRGGALSPEELRTSQQEARTAWSARGLGRSPAGAVDEILNSDALRRRRLLEAQQQGLRTAGVASAVEGDPFQTVMGFSPQGYGQGAYDSASPLPLLGYASDLYNTNYNAAASAANAGANDRASLYGSLIGAGGRILGGG